MTPLHLNIQGQLRSFLCPLGARYYKRSVSRHFQSHHFRRSHRYSIAVKYRVVEADPAVHRERSSLDVGRSLIPLNTLVVYRLVFGESSSRNLWLGERTSEGFTSLSLVFMKAPLGIDLWAV